MEYTHQILSKSVELNLLVVFREMTLYSYICDTHIGCIVKTWCNEHDCINDFMINNI